MNPDKDQWDRCKKLSEELKQLIEQMRLDNEQFRKRIMGNIERNQCERTHQKEGSPNVPVLGLGLADTNG